MLSKIGRWTAGRLQGSQGVQKYDGFMARNPWARAGLDVAGGLALGAVTGGLGGVLASKGGVVGALGKGVAGAGRFAGRTGMLSGAAGLAGARGGASGPSQLDQLNERGMNELSGLRDQYRNYNPADPMDGMSYDDPSSAMIDRAASSQWASNSRFDPTIRNDALDGYRNATFDNSIANDPAAGFNQRFANAFNPALDGPDAMEDMGTAYRGMMMVGGPGSGADVSGFAAPGVQAGQANVDLSALDNFDADAAFERYATGANNRFMSSLQSGLDNLRNSAAGGNRLNTGFFDLDSGKLGRDLRQDAANDISAAALQTNQQNLAARQAAAGFRTNMATTNAQLSTEASVANARNAVDSGRLRLDGERLRLDGGRLRLDALESASRNAQNRATMQRDDRNFRADRFDVQTRNLQDLAELRRKDRQFNADRFDADRDRDLNVADRQRQDRRFNFDAGQAFLDREDARTTNNRATWLNAASQQRAGWQAGNDMRMRASDMVEDRRRDRRNSYLDMLSGMTDRAQGVQNARDQRRANSQQSWLNLAGTAAGIGANMWMNRRGGSKPVLTVGGR